MVMRTEIEWVGDMRVTRIFKDGRLTVLKQHTRNFKGQLKLVSEERRTYHDNGVLKELWRSNGIYYRFDSHGNVVGIFNPY